MQRCPELGCTLALLLLGVPAQAGTPASLLAAGRIDEVTAVLQERVASHPDDAEAWNLLCRAWLAVDQAGEGLEACEKACELAPTSRSYHSWLGQAFGRAADAGNMFRAIRLASKAHGEFEKALELDPSGVEARSDLAEYYLEAPGFVGGGLDKAETQAETLMTDAPARAHWLLGRVAEKRSDAALALREYRAAIDADRAGRSGVESRAGAGVWRDLALYYHRSGDHDGLQSAAREVAASPDADAPSLADTARALVESGRDPGQAAELLRRALLAPASEEAPSFLLHHLLGTALEALGDREGAIREFTLSSSLASRYGPPRDARKKLER